MHWQKKPKEKPKNACVSLASRPADAGHWPPGTLAGQGCAFEADPYTTGGAQAPPRLGNKIYFCYDKKSGSPAIPS